MKTIFIIFCSAMCVFSASLKPVDFEVIKKEVDTSPTLLLIGGIQGDEPGGFNATNVFNAHYKIFNGSVWIVPVINKHSMLLNDRGIYGDMNRKFADLSPNDPEFFIIEHIKNLINDPQVSLVLHLHDGSGFWRESYQSALLNPNRWGNCTVIDQENLANIPYGNLLENATFMIDHINANLLKPIHKYHIHNTRTLEKNDVEMKEALTLYALSRNKPAYANEASKELNVQERVYYHLLAIEALLQKIGIKFERDFELSPSDVYKVINDPNLSVSIQDLPALPFFGLREMQNNFPLPKGKAFDEIELGSSARILGLVPQNSANNAKKNGVSKNNKSLILALKYGNRVLTKLVPYYVDFAPSLSHIQATIDSKDQAIAMNSTIKIKDSITLAPIEGYAIKVVGLKGTSFITQSTSISQHNLAHNASLDKDATLYRVEFYKTQEPKEPDQDKMQDKTQQELQTLKNIDKEIQTHISTTKETQNAESKLESSVESSTKSRLDSVKSNTESKVDSRQKAQVKVNLAHIRAEPNTQSQIIAKSPKGREMFVLDVKDNWAKITYQFKDRQINGFILERLLQYQSPQYADKAESSVESSTKSRLDSVKSNTESKVDSRQKAQVKVNLAHIRAEPNTQSQIIAKSPKGREMFVLDVKDNWAKITYQFKDRQINGFILERLLQYQSPQYADKAESSVESSTKSRLDSVDSNLESNVDSRPKIQSFSGMIVLDFSK